MSGKKRKLAVTRDKCGARHRSVLLYLSPSLLPSEANLLPPHVWDALGWHLYVVEQIWREAAMCSSISGRGQDRRYERCPSPAPRRGGYAESE